MLSSLFCTLLLVSVVMAQGGGENHNCDTTPQPQCNANDNAYAVTSVTLTLSAEAACCTNLRSLIARLLCLSDSEVTVSDTATSSDGVKGSHWHGWWSSPTATVVISPAAGSPYQAVERLATFVQMGYDYPWYFYNEYYIQDIYYTSSGQISPSATTAPAPPAGQTPGPQAPPPPPPPHPNTPPPTSSPPASPGSPASGNQYHMDLSAAAASSSNKSSSIAVVVAAVIGGFCAVAIFVVVLCCWLRRGKSSATGREPVDTGKPKTSSSSRNPINAPEGSTRSSALVLPNFEQDDDTDTMNKKEWETAHAVDSARYPVAASWVQTMSPLRRSIVQGIVVVGSVEGPIPGYLPEVGSVAAPPPFQHEASAFSQPPTSDS